MALRERKRCRGRALRRALSIGACALWLGGCRAPGGPLVIVERTLAERPAPLLAGVGEADFTPPPGYPLAGYGGGGRPTLQVMAERRDRRPMTVEDCARISRALSAVLDVEDPVPGAYDLEVSSPGLDRPLVRAEDYTRFAGFEAKVNTRAPIDGRRRFRGRVLGLDDDGTMVRLATADGEVAIAIDEIEAAKLVLTEDLLATANVQ